MKIRTKRPAGKNGSHSGNSSQAESPSTKARKAQSQSPSAKTGKLQLFFKEPDTLVFVVGDDEEHHNVLDKGEEQGRSLIRAARQSLPPFLEGYGRETEPGHWDAAEAYLFMPGTAAADATPFRLDQETHRALLQALAATGQPPHEFVESALREKIESVRTFKRLNEHSQLHDATLQLENVTAEASALFWALFSQTRAWTDPRNAHPSQQQVDHAELGFMHLWKHVEGSLKDVLDCIMRLRREANGVKAEAKSAA